VPFVQRDLPVNASRLVQEKNGARINVDEIDPCKEESNKKTVSRIEMDERCGGGGGGEARGW